VGLKRIFLCAVSLVSIILASGCIGSDQKPQIVELKIYPENPVVNKSVNVSITIVDDKGVRGFQFEIGKIKRRVNCNNEKICSRNASHTVPNMKEKTLLLRIIAADNRNQTTVYERQVIIVHETGNPVCGNGLCETTENPDNCIQDCTIDVICGDDICEANETAQNCPTDCTDRVLCGDGVCEGDENIASCPFDCQPGTNWDDPDNKYCGNGICENGETEESCPDDCWVPCMDCVSDQDICQKAAENMLCDGLDITYGAGYAAACCIEHGYCCQS